MSNVTALKTLNSGRRSGWSWKETPKGNNLKAIRVSLGLTINQACSLLAVGHNTLCLWEAGHSKPQRNNWARLCSIYRESSVQPTFTFEAGYPISLIPNDAITREIVSDCPQTRVRIVKETY